MVELAVISFLVILTVGLIVKVLTPYIMPGKEITSSEFRLGAMAVIPIVVVIFSLIGYTLAREAKLSKNQFISGWETAAVQSIIYCERDGNCTHTYKCDKYTICRDVCVEEDDDGDCVRTERQCTDYWHDCPYCTHEDNYTVESTIGPFEIASHRLPNNPAGNRWTGSSDAPWNIPDWVIQNAGVGEPEFWLKVWSRVHEQKPGPVTRANVYKNYIQAADDNPLKPYSPNVDSLLSLGILPKITAPSHEIYSYYYANKVYFVGWSPSNPQEWYDAMARLNASVGNDLQGDVHLVIIQSSVADSDPQSYINTLNAYWQDEKYFDDDTFAKNGVLFVAGTDGHKVTWLRADTGVPGYNGIMIETVAKIRDIDLTPQALIGNLTGEYYTNEKGELDVRPIHGNGVIEDIVFGLSNPETRFTRPSMTGKDADDVGSGFTFFDVKLDPAQNVMIIIFNIFLGSAFWLLCAYADISNVVDNIRSNFR